MRTEPSAGAVCLVGATTGQFVRYLLSVVVQCEHHPEKAAMNYHEFVCAGAPTLRLVTADPELNSIPPAAQRCCLKWTYSRAFLLGDASLSSNIEAAVKAQLAHDGYHIYVRHADPRRN